LTPRVASLVRSERGAGGRERKSQDSGDLMIAEITALPISSDERWQHLTASKWPRDNEFFLAMMDLVAETDHETYLATCPKTPEKARG